MNELTPRETEIVKLLSEGKTVKEIAAQLSLSNKTVEYHSLRARRKIGDTSIAGLTRFALTNADKLFKSQSIEFA